MPLAFRERALRAFGDRAERGGVTDGDVGEHLAVQRRAGGLEAGDQLRIADAVRAGGGADAGDPELAEVALAILAAGEGGVEPLLDLLFRDAVTAGLHPPVAAGELHHFGAAVLPLGSSFDSRHGLLVSVSFREIGRASCRE